MSDARVVSLIRRNFVPVAVNLNTLRRAKNDAGRYFRAIHKQKPQWQGFWIVSPAGKVLAAHLQFKSEKTWTNEVLATLQTGLRAFGKVKPRRVRSRGFYPQRGVGLQQDGSVTVALYIRHVFSGKQDRQCVLDSVTFTAGEFRAFAPGDLRRGSRWSLPKNVVGKLCRALSPDSDLVTRPKANEVTQAQLTGQVHRVIGQTVIVTYQGNLAAQHPHPLEKNKFSRHSARLTGVAEYDVKTRRLRALALVLDGVYHMFQPWHREPRTIIAGVEWQLKTRQ